MSNSKRIYRFAGRPEVLDDIEREYHLIWIQPTDDSRPPKRVKAYELSDRWVGWIATDAAKVELTWLKTLWKQVPDPFADDSAPTPRTTPPLEPLDDSEDDTLEVPTE